MGTSAPSYAGRAAGTGAPIGRSGSSAGSGGLGIPSSTSAVPYVSSIVPSARTYEMTSFFSARSPSESNVSLISRSAFVIFSTGGAASACSTGGAASTLGTPASGRVSSGLYAFWAHSAICIVVAV